MESTMSKTAETETGVAITPEMTVNEIVQRYPATLPVLTELGIDTCCGGEHALVRVAQKHRLDLLMILQRVTDAATE